MMKSYIIFICFIFICSCTVDSGLDDPIYRKIVVENASNESITMSFYKDTDKFAYSNLEHRVIIPSKTRLFICEIDINDPTWNYECEGERFMPLQVVFQFPDEKGYYCDIFHNTDICFANPQRDFFNLDDFQVFNDELTFFITQEDYENAHELPE